MCNPKLLKSNFLTSEKLTKVVLANASVGKLRNLYYALYKMLNEGHRCARIFTMYISEFPSNHGNKSENAQFNNFANCRKDMCFICVTEPHLKH